MRDVTSANKTEGNSKTVVYIVLRTKIKTAQSGKAIGLPNPELVKMAIKNSTMYEITKTTMGATTLTTDAKKCLKMKFDIETVFLTILFDFQRKIGYLADCFYPAEVRNKNLSTAK